MTKKNSFTDTNGNSSKEQQYGNIDNNIPSSPQKEILQNQVKYLPLNYSNDSHISINTDSETTNAFKKVDSIASINDESVNITDTSQYTENKQNGSGSPFDKTLLNKGKKPKDNKTITYKFEQPLTLWQAYCYIITFWAPAFVLSLFGMPQKERQMAWREKIALISMIFYCGSIVAFLTFGFTKTVCKAPGLRLRSDQIVNNQLIINGRVFFLDSWIHPEIAGIPATTNMFNELLNFGGSDASFLFQNVNGNCKGLIKPRDNCTIPHDNEGNLAWYFPCKLLNKDGLYDNKFDKFLSYDVNTCHTSKKSRDFYYNKKSDAELYFTWEDIQNSTRNLVVANGNVLDLDLLNLLESESLLYPPYFDYLKQGDLKGYDISMLMSNSEQKKVMHCLTEIIRVGSIDSETIGCIASDIVLYLSLIFILSIVIAKFLVACYFNWIIAKKQGAFSVDNKALAEHTNVIEDWSQDIYKQGPIKNVEPHLRPVKGSFKQGGNASTTNNNSRKKLPDFSKLLPLYYNKTGSKLYLEAADHNKKSDNGAGSVDDTSVDGLSIKLTRQKLLLEKSSHDLQYTCTVETSNDNMTTMTTQSVSNNKLNTTNPWNEILKEPGAPLTDHEDSKNGIGEENKERQKLAQLFFTKQFINRLDPSIIHPNAVLQPPPYFKPNGYPLIHTICFVTCYSEDEVGLRTTLDSISTTDYPNSHKLIMILCDGLIKGSGNDKTTPDIVLDMMEDCITTRDEVTAHSYIAVASGSKRHNMAKVYAGFYKYNDATVPIEKQQRVPLIAIVKTGTPNEAGTAKPGNRGKRDSQVILMSFLQKLTFNERMTDLEYEILKNIWCITGLMPDFYEAVLMVDADTKVFPDSLTHMLAEMVKDPEIMGLCGETKISNKKQSWVTAIQVFEYYISHHQSKAFESVFGSVTCLPGCFSIYRIKSPKGKDGFWVPILANSDIVEKYSDNVTNSLHKKNLLLLGEDRYLSSLMLRTFPKRKQIFLPKAACKTVVPDKFKVLLSQRRRWINSTVHNLFELVLINDLCGTFCFSMQFVIFIELVGTLVLPLAICFTIYVIIFSIFSQPTPVITLVLLAIILGLPGVLIIVNATRWSYLAWLFIYILALPIWNFVLPTYAYWKFDDFSWGDTRTITTTNSNAAIKTNLKEETEDDFDYSQITLRTWREFEIEERLKRYGRK
ncbi:chitin synthase CHS3 SCDLUD_005051 [Saccharomycodes ludwigii]|uniref:chitin synthase CHS3 n=1 Tax=Saccharomycodes ludwigii TaxID=36035 RepID=UPI001E86EAFA|nr:hypothetical protein SCDLUD_005051 [Saccharomycodes ludwigii]KAH3898726.1 hypothetical protein SCDLUD_005051 [Saccharomycodes ludwigii]